MTKGDHVVWIHGAVGLTGRIVDFQLVPLAPSSCNVLLKIETEHGTFHEYPHNLKISR
jgi:hypothetical protein